MKHLQFVSFPADPDVLIQEAEIPDGRKYYELVLLYTDDAMCISHKAEHVMRYEIGNYFDLKEDFIGTPKLYL